MRIVHIVRGNYTPESLNGVYKVIDNLSIALANRGANCSMQCNPKSERNNIRISELSACSV